MKYFTVCAVAFLLLLGNLAVGLETGTVAPGLKIDKWLNGEPVSLVAGKGKNVYVILFWGTFNLKSREALTLISKIQKKYKDKGVIAVGLSNESIVRIERFIKPLNLEFAIAGDPNGTTYDVYMRKVLGFPCVYVVDKTGKIAWRGSPFEMEPVLNQIVDGTYSAVITK